MVEVTRKPGFRPAHRTTAPVGQAEIATELPESETVEPITLGSREVEIPTGTSTTGSIEILVKEIPSVYKPYPAGTKVFYKPYTYDEINYFSNSKVDLATTFKKIMEGIRTEGMDAYDLTLMDFFYVALLRKLSSLGTPQFTLKYRAFGLEQMSVITFDQIDFKDLEVPALPAVTTIGGKEMHFSPMTVRSHIQLIEKDLVEDDAANLAMCCVNLPFEETWPAIKKATGLELLALDELDKCFGHYVNPVPCNAKFEYPNPEFDDTQPEGPENMPVLEERRLVNVHLGSPETLILPFRGSGDVGRSLLSFGL